MTNIRAKFSKPIITIVIPTKDRYDMLEQCLKTFENLEGQDIFEVLIFDSSKNKLEVNIERFNIENIRYIYKKVDGFCETFSRSLDYVQGEYVIIIGDDDAILPSLLDAAVWANNTNADCITPRMRAGYIWPGIMRQMGGNRDADRLLIQNFTSSLTKVDAKIELGRVISSAFQEFDYLPKIYHGIVKFSKMKELKQIYGDYFIGSSPDISAAIALATIVENHYVVDFPLTLPGSSPKSGAGASLGGKHIGPLEKSPLAQFISVWPPNLPKIYTVQTMWAFSGIYVLKKYSASAKIELFNPDKLLAATMIYNLSDAYKIIKAESGRLDIRIPHLIRYLAFYFFRRLIHLTDRFTHRGQYDLAIDKRGLTSITGAQKVVIELLQEKKSPFFSNMEVV